MHFYKDQSDHFYVQLDNEEVPSPELKHISIEEHDGDETKHQPIITIENNQVKVKIGDVMHPMTAEHHISMIFLKSKQGGQYKILTSKETPIVVFELSDEDEAEEVYGYCNLHGLWKELF